ncbi:prophage endopeptidase tail family protein [Lysinibacillus sp. NPDC096418]|uniref:prophage endopeptidase tail family protein n=1 Tax=Lysinibacillus sp. NPDC096418 TaxID=3364138 RepID=UPI00380FF1C2
MIYVSKGSEVEPLIQFNNLDIVKDTSGSLTLSLISLNVENNPGHKLLVEESIIHADDLEFRIKQITEYRTHKEMQAVSTFFDLVDTRRNVIFDKTLAPLSEFLDFTLGNTSWSYTTEITASFFIQDFGDDNVVSLLNRLCEHIGAWYEIKPNKNIVITYKLSGSYNDSFYRYGYNVKSLSKHVDTTNLKTFIRGTGANGITTSYTAPTATQFGIREATPIVDEKITSVGELQHILKNSIVSEPQISLELDTIELVNKSLGERVWLIYEPLDIELSTKIMTIYKTFRNGEIVPYKVVIGNSVPKNASDLFVDTMKYIEQSKKQMLSDLNKHQTNMINEMESLMVLGVPYKGALS